MLLHTNPSQVCISTVVRFDYHILYNKFRPRRGEEAFSDNWVIYSEFIDGFCTLLPLSTRKEKLQTRTTAQTMIHPMRYADFDYKEEIAAIIG
jgi:hypothetical protein